VFLVVAFLLTLVLIALVIYLLWFLGRPAPLGPTVSQQGIEAIWQSFGPGTSARPLFSRPMGVAVGSGDRIYVTDAENDRVCVFDVSGRFLFEFGERGVAKPAPGVAATYEPGRLNYPVGIDADRDGNVYVASLYNDSIEVYDPEGTPLRRFPDPLAITGRGGSGYGGLGIAVTDVAVHKDRVYATDTYQILVFNRRGDLIDQWGRPGSDPGGLDHPNGLAVGADGTVYVSDTNHGRVTAFSPEGQVRWQVGEIPVGLQDESERQLVLPRGLAVLPDGSVLVVDAFGFELVRISADGEVLNRYGQRGVQPAEFNFSNDVEAVRSLVILADKENGRIQMLRLLD
jgi:DNA-binding beta-propeller fold protein YncE